MNAERLIELFERVGEAPGAVAKLRDLVFHLAIRGRLTSDSVCRGIGRAEDCNASIDDGLSEADVPAGWNLAPLASLGAIRGGGTPSKSNPEYWDGDVPWVSPKDMKSDHISDSGLHISRTATEETPARLLPPGCVLFVVRGMILAHSFPVALTKTSVTINQDMKALELADPRLGEFVLLALKALRDCVLTRVQRSSHGTCRLEGDSYLRLRVPIPPFAEQQRILKRVAELMDLCDQLESAQTEREQRRDRLVTASLQRLREPVEDGTELREHAAFHLRHMGRMTTRVEHVRELREAVLAMAVRGQLLPRRATESSNVEDCSRESEPSEPHIDMRLPRGWKWVRVAEVAEARLGKMLDKARNTGVPYPYLGNTNVHWFDIRHQRLKELPVEAKDVTKYTLNSGDVLICEGGHGIARTAVWRGPSGQVAFQKALHRVRPGPLLDSDYFSFVMFEAFRAGVLQRLYTGVGIPHFTGQALASVVFPLPPKTEQTKIVAKVHQLLSLCADLESAFLKREQEVQNLLGSLLATALAVGPVASNVGKTRTHDNDASRTKVGEKVSNKLKK